VVLDASASSAGVNVILTSSSTHVTVPGSVTIPAGSESVAFTATVGAAAPGGENVTIAATKSGAGSIVKQTALQVKIAQLSSVDLYAAIFPGASSIGTIRFDLAPSAPVTVNLASSNSGVSVPATVTVAAGQLSQTFTATAGQAATLGPVTITATASRAGSTVTKQGTATLKPIQVWKLEFSPLSIDRRRSDDQKTTTGTITLEHPAGSGGIVVNLSCCGYDAGATLNTMASVPASATVPAGQTTVTFTATIPVEQKDSPHVIRHATVSAVRAGQPASEAKTGRIGVRYY
jgi:hypothetical protein